MFTILARHCISVIAYHAPEYISAERFEEALEIIHSGACLQLQNGQVTCGSELAALFVETLVKGKVPYSQEIVDLLRKIYEAFPRVGVPQLLEDDDDMQKLSEALGAAKIRVEGCSSFFRATIRWSFEFGTGAHKYGSPKLHEMLAEYICSESPEVDMAKASYHFVRGKSPEKFAATLVNFMAQCYPGEDDLAIARAVLMFLSLGNMRDANHLMDEVKKLLDSKNEEFPESDLIQFIVYLLQALERDALPLFRMLRQNYNSSIDRDSTLNEATPRLSEDKGKQCVDPKLNGDYPPKAVAKLAAVAALCVQYEADFRPNMTMSSRHYNLCLTPNPPELPLTIIGVLMPDLQVVFPIFGERYLSSVLFDSVRKEAETIDNVVV